MIKRWLLWFALFGGITGRLVLGAAVPGEAVAVVYNRLLPESKNVAEYYAERRQVPPRQVIGLDLPKAETISRNEFRDLLQKSLLKALEQQRLFHFRAEIKPATATAPGQVFYRLSTATIRYLALCYGVPLRIAPEPSLNEKGEEKIRLEFRRNEAAVDAELALLPLFKQDYPLTGPLQNPHYLATNSALLHPTNGLLMVTRLDGPSASIARGLVDKAIQAETDGLWGRGYFDARGFTNGNYRIGDDWIRGAATVCHRMGFDTVLDDKPETFSPAFPMSQIAFYAGWYDYHVSGPFTRPHVEFMPGAVAYHLQSSSAHSLRTASQFWAGPLLDKGATATMGCVEEPYLDLTPNVAVFFARLLTRGFTFGEAAYAAQPTLSWQTTVIGDPLYCPFGKPAQDQHADLQRRKHRSIVWSHLRVVNLNAVTGIATNQLVAYLEGLAETAQSAVLQEKLGQLYHAMGKSAAAIEALTTALKLDTTPQQRIRVMLQLDQWLAQAGRDQAAYELLQQFLKEFPDYPDLLLVYRRLLPLAQKLGALTDAERYQREISRLAPPTPAPN
jgi:uncharacterized protein (TIGR03790 family)